MGFSPVVAASCPGGKTVAGWKGAAKGRVLVRLWQGFLALVCFSSLLLGEAAVAAQRFPPPDFESGHQLPATTTPAPRALAME